MFFCDLQTFFGLIVGADNISKTAPFLECFASARSSATTIFQIIDRVPKIDAMSDHGKIINFGIKGNIKFKNVAFSYPSRPDVPILRNMNFSVNAGETVALVGSSGNGKSTCLHLLQRFYDPDGGQISIDGCDIKHLNISLLRSNMALVGQEPVLFSTSISENIRYGKPDASEKEIMAAAQDAGAHDFISRLPQGYNTLVGEKGCQMSGGQKQRIAIARALIQNPRILILDEATSALDYQSEKYVQQTLDSLSKGRSTLVVSHRLSAIRNADRILFIDKGEVLEEGSHNDLLQLRGKYYDMVMAGTLDIDDAEHTNTVFSSKKINEKHENPEKIHGKQLFGKQMSFEDEFTGDLKEIDAETEVTEEKTEYWTALKRILSIARPEWIHLFLATVSAILIGASFPIFAVLFGEFYGVSKMIVIKLHGVKDFRCAWSKGHY